MADRASLTVFNPRAEPFDATLEIELSSFPMPRAMSVTLDDHHVATITVDPERRWHAIAPLRLAVGPHVVAFRADPTLVSTVTPGARDDRRLAIRVGRWRWQRGAVP
jgi:hypothetical protein